MGKGLSRHAGVAILAAALLAGSACEKDFRTNFGDRIDQPVIYAAATAPDSLLENLMIAYSVRDPVEYAALLAEDFAFEFSDIDQEDPDVPSDPYDRATEVGVHEVMFDATLVQTLTIEYEFDPATLAVDPDLSTPTDTLWTLLVTNLDLLLYGGDSTAPE